MSKITNFLFPKKKKEFNRKFAIVKLTDPAKNSFINDNFNKIICVYKSFREYKLNLPPEKEIPFTEADLKNIMEVWNIPIIEERLETDYEFEREPNFGEIINKVR